MSEPLPWTPDHELTVEQVRAALADALPDATLGGVAYLAAGWDNFAYDVEVDGVPWVFRFPKREERVAYLLTEVRVLDVLRPVVPAPVPHAHGPLTSEAVPYPFAGYPKLPGTQIMHRATDWPHAAHVATGLAAFLTALHDIPVSAYDHIGIPDYRAESTIAKRRENALTALTRIANTLPPTLVRDVRAALATDVTDPPEFRAVHCDLGDDHILTDDDGRLTAIIDWADFSLASPHSDFVGGTMAFGDAFLLPALAAYGRPTDAGFAQRVRFSSLSVMVSNVDWGRHAEDPTWTAWNRTRLPERVAELLRS